MASHARTIELLLSLMLAVPCVGARDQEQPTTPPQQPPDVGGAQPQGEEEAAPLPRTPQNDRVPVAGVEDYRLDGLNLGRSFVVTQVQFNELYATNPNNSSTRSGAQSDNVSNLRGSLALQFLSRRTAIDLDYRPGLLIYDQGAVGTAVLQQFGISEKLYLRRWTLVFGDDFSYLPQAPIGLGAFAGGGATSAGLPGTGGGLTNFNGGFVPGQFIQAQSDRLTNAVLGQAQYTFGPRSAVNFSSYYGQVHFFDPAFVNSRSVGLRFGYDYTISQKQTLTVAYSFNRVFYPIGKPGLFGNSVLVGYRRTITGKLALTLEGGPQFSRFQSALTTGGTRLSYLTRAIFRYLTPRNAIDLTYQHRLTEGSGVSIGAQSDIVNALFNRIVSRNWTAAISSGFTHNRSLNQATGAVTNLQFNSWNGNFTASRRLSQNTSLEFHYSLARQTSNISTCIKTTVCGSVFLNQQIGMGLTWNSRPYSID